MTVFVFANGEIEGDEWLRPLLPQASLIIAADGGTRHLFALGRLPDVLIGDMDSVSPELEAWLAETAVSRIHHSPHKDETDLELALLYALTVSDAPIWVFGALGGRLDQTLANILLLAHPRLAGRQIELRTERERAWLMGVGETAVSGQPGDLISLIPLGGDVRIQATTGLVWPLREETLAFGPARGVSNVMEAETATICVSQGQLLCVHTVEGW